MNDDADPNGITRPDVAALQADPLGEACADERATIRAHIAAAKDRVAMWEPQPPPQRQPHPATPTTVGGHLPSPADGRQDAP